MSALNASTKYNLQFFGEQGNASVALGKYVAASAQIADTIDLLTMPEGGLTVTSAHLINAALGASSTVALGWRYLDGSAGGSATAFFGQTATSSAGRINSTNAPIDVEKAIVIYATVAGGAITGQIDVVVQYVVRGNL